MAEDADGVWVVLFMEFLDHEHGWRHPFELDLEYSEAQISQAKKAVLNALDHAHDLELEGEGVTTVHGDCRGPNILARQDDSTPGT